jgi:luciferase family oxidoreductase group 1
MKPLGDSSVPLSILDAMNVGTGYTASDAIQTSIQLAKLGESRGFARHWVAEHHSFAGVGASSPAVVLAHLAAHTNTIRLGSGGVMLPNHPPLIVAEQFGAIEAMAPGRIDLGLGRAPGTDVAAAAALRRTGKLSAEEDFPRQVLELIGFLDDSFPDGHPYQTVHAIPGVAQAADPLEIPGTGRPPVWLLGSSGYSARLAARLGLPFAFGHHFAPHLTTQILDLYRSRFRPSVWLDHPYALISVGVLAADTAEEAHRQIQPNGLVMALLRTAQPGLFPSPEFAATFRYSPIQREIADSWNANTIAGTGEQVSDRIRALTKATRADEIMLTTYAHKGETRLRSYDLIADAFALPKIG